jgi:hypothetical protein
LLTDEGPRSILGSGSEEAGMHHQVSTAEVVGSEQSLEGGDPAHVIELLQESALAVDTMWMHAAFQGCNESAFALAEASQGVHRALMALDKLEIHPDS